MTIPGEELALAHPDARQSRSYGGVRIDRVVVGVLIGTVGVGWLLDEAGVSVPWHLLPAAALILIGIALLVTLLTGHGRGALIGLGIAATIAAVAVGVGADRYAGPAGDRLVAPTAAEWPLTTRVSAGNVTVDLTEHELPGKGNLQVDVGAGELHLVLPAGAAIGVEAWTTAGTVTVDNVKIGDGIDVRWTQDTTDETPVTVELHVGMGNIEVSHE